MPLQYPQPILDRYKELFKEEYENTLKISEIELPSTIRTNTLKITPEELKKRLEKRGWKVTALPFYPDAFTVETEETLGNTIEHLLGYYYVQDAASMLPPLCLEPKPGEIILDMCAAPGSKTTEIAQMMHNEGVIVANETDMWRSKALIFNLQRCGVLNAVVTKHVGQSFPKKGILFDKVLVDAPCSAEGTVRNDWTIPKKLSPYVYHQMAKVQKELLLSGAQCLKEGGILIYSTCTFAPEENEMIVNEFLTANPEYTIEEINLSHLKTREGITTWQGRTFNPELKKTIRILPQDNNTEGFFVAKIKKQ